MSVISLTTKNFRNLANGVISLHEKNNYFIGDNGSGKSSLLEAIFFVGHGKSFRTAKTDHLVTHSTDDVTVSVLDSIDTRLGISRNITNGDVILKANGEKLTRLSELAKNIAVQIVTPESFKLFFGGARERRRFLDLGLFHVKHSFADQYRDFVKIQKQRNACLRQRLDQATLNYWTELFCSHSSLISQSREDYVEQLKNELSVWLKILMPTLTDKITISYLRGWHQKKSLLEVLSENKERELQVGYSLFGAHKFDIRFLVDKKPIELALSRGQQKLFLLALTFAQSKLIERVKPIKPILLIDDVGAELDIISRRNLHQAIIMLNCQVLITAIDASALQPLVDLSEVTEDKNYKMFHVKHGEISETTK